MAAEDIEQKPFDVADSERVCLLKHIFFFQNFFFQSKTSVIASLLAAGYGVGTDTLTKAKEYDDKHMITLSLQQGLFGIFFFLSHWPLVNAGAEKVKARALEIDEQYKISETLVRTVLPPPVFIFSRECACRRRPRIA